VKHHIQPRYAKGLESSWNFVFLTHEEHIQAHQLLYECYQNQNDYFAFNMMSGNTTATLVEMRKANHKKMKENKTGFYNSELQQELGCRSKNRAPKARHPLILAALQRGFVLLHNPTGTEIFFEPGRCINVVQVVDIWMDHVLMAGEREKWKNCEKKASHTYVTRLTCMLTGSYNKKSNKRCFALHGWSLKGIFI
jgi:hypothetical protein